MRILLIGFAALLAACAATLPPDMPLPPVSVGQEVYVIDPSHTFPSFEISHLGFSTHRGRFNKTAGWVILDRTAHSGSMELKIDADSIDTGDPRLEQRLRADDFDAAAHPTITFKADQLHFTGETLAAVEGTLEIRGVTRPVTLTVTAFHCGKRPIFGQQACGADAEATVKRAEFGISAYPSMIGADVKLLIQVEAVKR